VEVGSPVSGGFPRPVARVVPHHRGLPQFSFVEGPYPQCVWAGGYTRSARLTLSALPVQRSRAGCEMPFLPSPFSGLVQHPLGWILAGWSYFSLSASQAWQPGSTWVTLRPHWCSPSRDLGSDSIFLTMGYCVQHRLCCPQGRLLAAALFVCPPALHGVVAGASGSLSYVCSPRRFSTPGSLRILPGSPAAFLEICLGTPPLAGAIVRRMLVIHSHSHRSGGGLVGPRGYGERGASRSFGCSNLGWCRLKSMGLGVEKGHEGLKAEVRWQGRFA